MFWRELKDGPDTAFGPRAPKNAAWNLYRAMGRGARRSDSDWDRALIEDQLGEAVADRLRLALMPIWRRQQLPLPSERPEEERNTFYETWILALTAIAAEAEDPLWLNRLDASEIDSAIRYVSWCHTGFLPFLFAVASDRAVTRFEAICEAIPVARHNEAVKWFGTLFGRHHRGRGVNLKQAAMTPDLLIRLLRLVYTHVELAEDAQHEGSYLPDMRDDAETARYALLSAIIDLGGPEGWAAKHRIASEPEFAHIRDRLHSLAMEKSAAEADDMAISAGEIVKFDRLDEPGLRSPAEMFALMSDRLADLRDHLLSDESPRELWALTEEEHVLRRAIVAWLTSQARVAYTIGQEGVTAEETDIRFRSTVNGVEGVIELKVGDKPYSGPTLPRQSPTSLSPNIWLRLDAALVSSLSRGLNAPDEASRYGRLTRLR